LPPISTSFSPIPVRPRPTPKTHEETFCHDSATPTHAATPARRHACQRHRSRFE
jgi:hypothetical protein